MKFTHKLTSPEYITKVRYVYMYACMYICMCIYICMYVRMCVRTINHHIISQEELRKVMSDSLSTAHVEVFTLALMYHVFDILVIILHQ